MGKPDDLNWKENETHGEYLKRLDDMAAQAEQEYHENTKQLRKARIEDIARFNKQKELLEIKRERIVGRAIIKNILSIDKSKRTSFLNHVPENERKLIQDLIDIISNPPEKNENENRNFPSDMDKRD